MSHTVLQWFINKLRRDDAVNILATWGADADTVIAKYNENRPTRHVDQLLTYLTTWPDLGQLRSVFEQLILDNPAVFRGEYALPREEDFVRDVQADRAAADELAAVADTAAYVARLDAMLDTLAAAKDAVQGKIGAAMTKVAALPPQRKYPTAWSAAVAAVPVDNVRILGVALYTVTPDAGLKQFLLRKFNVAAS
jgi:hypothetical protein